MKRLLSHSASMSGRGAALVLLLAAAALPSCGGQVDGPVQILVAAYDPSDDGYRHVVANVRTLHNLRTMSGDAVHLLGGAKIVVDYDELNELKPKNAEQLEAITFEKRGSPVNFSWFERGGVVYPEDFHSLSLATIYFNFEKAFTFFRSVGAELPSLPVQYFPLYREGPRHHLEDQHDNAYWDPIIRTFAILPFKDVRELPMGMNAGIIGHEYAHAVFSELVMPGEGVPWLYELYFADPERYARAVNYVSSMNEGLADFFGAVIAGDPGFMRKSISGHAAARRLDPDQPHCMTAGMREAADSLPNHEYNPYPLGSVLAAALWEGATSIPGRLQAVAGTVVEGMGTLEQRFRQRDHRIDHITTLDAIASRIDEELRPRMCGLFIDRFGLRDGDLSACTASARLPEVRCAR